MAVRKFSQTDPRWATKLIGKTKLTLGRWGCLITSICMLHSRFYPKNPISPPVAAQTWTFTNDGLLYWSSFFEGMTFQGRFHGTPDHDTIKEWVRSKQRGMVLEVDNYHWVMAYYYPLNIGIYGVIIIDPLGGNIKPLALSGYQKVTGYALFSKILS